MDSEQSRVGISFCMIQSKTFRSNAEGPMLSRMISQERSCWHCYSIVILRL
nr:unnamed protein product [Callosobruchus analis]